MVAASEKKKPLTTDRIARAAVAYADANGIDGLSMRKLASELGAGVMSLYNHVANKEELFSAMVELVMSEIEAPLITSEDPPEWRRTMRASAMSAYQAYERHGWAVGASLKSSPGPRRLQHVESVLAAFAASGLDPAAAHHAYHVYEVHIWGFTLTREAFNMSEVELQQRVGAFLEGPEVAAFPRVAAHGREHLEERDSDFEFGLDLLLDGFERLRPAAG